MTSYTVSPKSGYSGCMLYLIPLILLAACHVSRSVATTHTNVDSIVSHVRDSSTHVTKMISEVYEGRIRELTNSSVVFETQPCPDEAEMLSLLDSIGKINYRNMVMGEGEGVSGSRTAERSSNLGATGSMLTADGTPLYGIGPAHVVVSPNGSIDATGRIKSVTVTTSRLQEENRSLSLRNDSLWHVVDSQKVVLNKKVDDKQVVVKRSVSWWFWVLFAIGCVASLGVGVALERKFG